MNSFVRILWTIRRYVVEENRKGGRMLGLTLTYGPDPNPPTGSYEDAKQTLPRE